MPEEWPEFSHSDLNEMKHLNYAELSAKIIRPFVEPCLSEKELLKICKDTYSIFNKDVAPLYKLNEGLRSTNPLNTYAVLSSSTTVLIV